MAKRKRVKTFEGTRVAEAFVRGLGGGRSPEELVREVYGGRVARSQEGVVAAKLMGMPEVARYVVHWFGMWSATWEDLEGMCRSSLSLAMSGLREDGQPLEATDLEKMKLKLAAASIALQSLAKTQPETLTERAQREDRASLTQRQMAVRVLGPVLREGNEPAAPV